MGLPVGEISGGSKAFQFDEIGDTCQGEITLIERRQQRGFDGGAPLVWDDGSPRMLTYVEVQTDLHDDGDDDGVRALYLKGGKNFEPAEGSGSSGEIALAEAAKAAGIGSIEEGSQIAVQFSGRAKATTRGYQPAKLFTAQLKAPVHAVAADDLFGDG